ncbi:MAG: nickel-dependent lactate racemase [Candidatus Atribacteria bacterium]|nr:nickel-dependent lactate racemase [Candidatus Atribacteria bacterium]
MMMSNGYGKIDTKGWKKVNIEYLEEYLTVEVPPECEILQMQDIPPLKEVKKEIENAFDHPIQSKTIEEIISSHEKPANEITVAIAVSDNTRPVPYHCEKDENILSPILSRLEKKGIRKENIKIIIGCGTHAPTTLEWKKKSFGEKVSQSYQLIDHDCYSKDLILVGDVMGVPVSINKDFMQADIHIVTGLVEAHFMAGASGGRKAVCPGMVNIEATRVFHGPQFMADKHADNLIFENNPCHEFALEVARRVRVDYTVNVLINGDHRICGVYTGDLEQSHQSAVEQLEQLSIVRIQREYDIVLTHAGKGAVNHYQAIKGAWGALPALKKDGHIILLAHNQDQEPIGSQYYKDLMKKFMEVGLGHFYPLISSKDWNFTYDQWEVQKWEQFFVRIGGFDHLIYCTVNILPEILDRLPGLSGYKLIENSSKDITAMVQNAIYYCYSQKKYPSMAFIKEGPYVVLKK